MANWGAGDGTYLDSQYGGYSIDGSVDPNSTQQQTVPLFGSGDYANGGNSSLFTVDKPNVTGNSLYVPSNANMVSSDYGAGSNDFGSSTSSLLGGAGAMGGTAGAVAGGVGAVVGSYENASTDTTSSVLSGAASGAMAGAAFGPWGMAIGAVVGGISGFFGSKSKKNQEKKAFQQQEQLAIAPQQQAQANWLQQEGLKQKAISNYASGYTPGGYNYTNALTGNKGGAAPKFAMPSSNPSLPNFAVAPPNVITGNGDSSLGIGGNNVPNTGLNLNPQHGPTNSAGLGNGGFGAAPTGFAAPTAVAAPTPGTYTGNKATDQASLSNYQKAYNDFLTSQNQAAVANSMNAYTPYGY